MPLPPLFALRAFEAAARSGSFSKAADLLNITPGAVSRHIRTLEQWFDCQLFLRKGPQVEITRAGQIFAVQLTEGFQNLERACDHFRSGRDKLRLKAPSTLTMRWLLAALHSIGNHAGSAQTEITSVWMDTDSIDFLREPYDCAILPGNGQFGAGTVSQLLFNEWLIPVCSPSLVSHVRQDICHCDLLHPSHDRRDWKRWLTGTGKFHDLDVFQGKVFDTLEQGIQAAAGGHGVSVGDLLLCLSAVKDNLLSFLFNEAVATGDGYYLVWPKASAAESRIKRLYEHLIPLFPTTIPDYLILYPAVTG